MISAINQIAFKKIQESKELLNILSTIEKETILLEFLMVERLKLFFSQLEHQVIELVEENELLTITLHNLVNDLITDNFEDYYSIISKYNKKAWEHGQVSTILLTAHGEASLKWFSLKANINIDTDNLFKPSDRVNEIISTRNFQASENTMTRINSNINKVLQDSYNEGWGTPKTTANLKNEFNKLKTWEARRIARTEINSAKNTASYQQLVEDDIDYIQWWTATDKLVRDSHQELHGLIAKTGSPFPNGLLHPGDRSGPISEWINCRCTPLAFIVPYDMMVPPGMSVFRESDLILIDHNKDSFNKDDFSDHTINNQGQFNGEDLEYYLKGKYPTPTNDSNIIDSALEYSGEAYDYINEYLRIGVKKGYYDVDEIKNHIFNLNKLTNMSEIKDHTILYRGQQYLFGESYEVGKTITKKEFISTSFDKNAAHDIGANEYLFKIYSPKGTKGVQLNDDLSFTPAEYEWLLSMNTKFKVLSFDESSKIIELLIIQEEIINI